MRYKGTKRITAWWKYVISSYGLSALWMFYEELIFYFRLSFIWPRFDFDWLTIHWHDCTHWIVSSLQDDPSNAAFHAEFRMRHNELGAAFVAEFRQFWWRIVWRRILTNCWRWLTIADDRIRGWRCSRMTIFIKTIWIIAKVEGRPVVAAAHGCDRW